MSSHAISPAAASEQPALPGAAAPVPVNVEGFIPGYSDKTLLRLVDRSVAGVPVPQTLADVSRSKWKLQVHVENIYMPRATTVVAVTMLDQKRVVAANWRRVESLGSAPRVVLCNTVSGLTKQLWHSVSQQDS
jgi:hypothetical protein